jgi:glycine cleavage system H protein
MVLQRSFFWFQRVKGFVNERAGGGKEMDKRKNPPQEDEGYPLIPEKELKCVWMTAGLVSYKLCKYEMQCEKCPLDWELRNISRTPSSDGRTSREVESTDSEKTLMPPPSEEGKPGDEFLKEAPSLFSIQESLFYHPGHTWIKVEKADVVRVGVDGFLAGLLTKVNVIILPLSGRQGAQGKNLCSIIQEEGILHIVSPVSGLILSVNQKLKDQPELIRRDPLGEGYLLTLKPKNLQRDQKHLLSGEEAFTWGRKEWERLKEALVSEFPPERGRLGITMQDGGILLREVKKLIDPRRYIHLVSAFLRNGEKSPTHVKSNSPE